MRKLSKILVLVLALAMLTAVFAISASAVKTTAPTTLYLTPNNNWKTDNARYAIYTWDGGDKWFDMKDTDGDGIYECEIPAGIENIIFCRMNPGTTANNWNNKWNQTSDLKYNGSNNHYIVSEGAWDKGAGTWTTFVPAQVGHECVLVEDTSKRVEPTCTTNGLKVEDCTAAGCDNPHREIVLAATGHSYVNHVCSVCSNRATYTVAGTGAHLGTEWDTANTANDMTYADGVYTKVYTNVAAGSYMLKVAQDHEWGVAYPDADKSYTVSTAGSTVTVTLKGTAVDIKVEVPHVHSWSEATCTELSKCECGETQGELAAHNYVAGEVVAPTYTAGGYTVYSCVCGLTENRDETAKLVPAFPEATVTPVENADLTFALNFGIKGVSIVDGEIVLDPEVLTEEYINAVKETYGRMYVDYRLTISGLNDPSVTLNSDGNADGYLGGQYDAWSGEWVYVPFGDSVVIENGKSLMIMEYAGELMGKPGLRQILEEIITVVVDFDCGVYFTPEFLEHNPDMVVTLELLVFNEDENGELTDVITVAENVFTVPHTHKHVAAVTAPTCTEAGYTTYTCDCGDTYTGDEVAALGHDYKNGAKCADCEAVPANDYLINFSEWRPFDKGTFADGDTVKYNDIFTFIYGKNSRVDASAKTWDDLSATLRFSLGGKTNSGVPTKNAIQITVDAAYTLKIWYVAGGDARNFVLVDAEGNVLSETTTDTVKNGQYYAELELAAAGTYYLTIPADNNYIFQLELVKKEVPHVNTLVVGDTNKIVISGNILNDYGFPIEWVTFVADEKAHYEITGEGLTAFIFDLSYNLLCLGTGKADLEAGTYLVCLGAYAAGEFNAVVTKTEIVVPEHKNELIVGENNKIVVDGSILNQNNNPIAWVPFVVTEKAHYAMTSETEGALVYIFDASYNLVCGGTGAAVLEPGTYLVCVGNGAVGDIYVQVTRTEISADCEHVYYYMTCSLCGAVNPYFEYNLMVAGSNKVICNEYHLVDTTGHGNPYQFTTFTLTEGGKYKFTSDKLVGFTIFTTEVNTEGADWTAGTGASWSQFIAGDEATLEAGTYYIGLIFVDGEGEYTINIDKVVEEEPPVEEPTEDPAPELNFFQKILAWFMELIQKLLAIFKR